MANTMAIREIMERSFHIVSLVTKTVLGEMSYERSTAHTINESPRNEAGDEEPGEEEARHQRGHVRTEPQRCGEDDTRVICLPVSHFTLLSRSNERVRTDNAVDTSSLLEGLDGASNQEPLLALNVIIVQQILPAP